MATKKEIRICDQHTKRVPLIWTFKFAGAEYWCPACGFTGGMFGSGQIVNSTRVLEAKKKEWTEKSLSYLMGETNNWVYSIKD